MNKRFIIFYILLFSSYLILGQKNSSFYKNITLDSCEMDPATILEDESGNLIITGRFKATSTAPAYITNKTGYRPHMFIYKLSPKADSISNIIPTIFQGITGVPVSGKGIAKTKEGNYLLACHLTQYRKENYEGDIAQEEYDKNFKVKNSKVIPAFYTSSPVKIIPAENGNFMVLGKGEFFSEASYLSEYKDPTTKKKYFPTARFIKINQKGESIIDTLYTVPSKDAEGNILSFPLYADDICPAQDGGFIVTGYYGDIMGSKSALVLKTDKDFNYKWHKRYQWPKEVDGKRPDSNYGIDITPSKSGGYVIAVLNQYNDKHYRLTKIDEEGKQTWTVNIDGSRLSSFKVIEDRDGNFVLAGYNKDSEKLILAKFSSDGKVSWEKSLDNNIRLEELKEIIETKDGGYLLMAISRASQASTQGILLIKTTKDGDLIK